MASEYGTLTKAAVSHFRAPARQQPPDEMNLRALCPVAGAPEWRIENFMKKQKTKKGEYGYLKHQRKLEIAKTAILFCLSLAVYLSGLLTTGTNKNLLTIVAVLGCLPASRSAVGMIMFLRAKGCSEELHERILPRAQGLPQLYDVVLTSYDATFELVHMVFKGNSLIGLTVNPKCKTDACEKHLKEMMAKDAIKDVRVKIFQDTPKYLNRLDQLRELSVEDTQTNAVFSLIKAISI